MQKEVEAFLSYLANDRKVSPSTHCQALAAILYLYKEVLDIQLPWMEQIGRPKQRIRVPVVLSRSEVAVLLAAIDSHTGWSANFCTVRVCASWNASPYR